MNPGTRDSKFDPSILGALLDALDSQSGADPKIKDRTSPRCAFRKATRLEVPQPKGAVILSALTRNISENGAALIAGRFVYPGSAIRMHLETPAAEPITVSGTIRHCRYLSGTGYLHEVGIAFDRPIDLATLNRSVEWARVELLAASDSRKTHRLVKDVVGGLNVGTTCVSSAEEVVETTLTCRPDLILLDLERAGRHGRSVIKRLRDEALVQPIIVLVEPAEVPTCVEATEDPLTRFVVKPLTRSRLLNELGAYVYPQLMSDYADDATKADTVNAFVASLTEQVRLLGYAFVRGDLDLARSTACQLRGQAFAAGFGPIAESAGALTEALADPAGRETARARLDEVMRLCRAAAPQGGQACDRMFATKAL